MDKERWDRIGNLFDRAIDLEPGRRAAFLAEACGDDAELLRELESMLATHDGLDSGFLAGIDTRAAAELLESAPTEPESAPERIGPWSVHEEIGRGGMGVVYSALRDDGQFEQQVALKLIKRGMDSDQILQRFLRERQILAAMDHPGIARLLDGGVTPEGRPWFALEYIEGMPLTDYCEQRGFDIGQRLELFSEVCQAVEYAHRNLVVHRDLKPSNILVDAAGRPRLLDFGIAKLLGDDGVFDATRTSADGRLMTPGYGAPELVLGGAITTATDVYSLGIILYELLAGKLPYRFEKGDITPQIVALADSEPPKLSALAAEADPSGDTKAIRRRLGRELDTIARKAIQADPDRRYVSAVALREDIERYLAGEPVLACPDSLPYRLGKLVRRNRASFAAAILVALSLVIGLGAALWQANIAAGERDLARQEAKQTEEVKDFIIDLFRATDPREREEGELTAERLLDRGLERVRTGLDARPGLRLELLTAIAEASKMLGDYEKAEEVFVEALAIEVGPEPRDRLLVATALTGLGDNYGFRENDDEAIELHRRALAIRLEHAGPESLQTAQSYNEIGIALASRRELPEAIEMYRQALRIQEKVIGETDSRTLNTLGNLGFALRIQGNYPEAERLLRSVIERMIRDQKEEHSTMIWFQSQLASVSRRLGKYPEAERLLKRSLELSRKTWGELHPTTRDMMNNYAMIAHALGNDAEAAELMKKNLAANLEQYGEEHPYIPLNHGNLGSMLLELGQVEEALSHFEIAEELHLRVSPPHYLIIDDMKHARARLANGQPDHARRLIDRALSNERQRETPSRDRLLRVLTVAGAVYGALGKGEEATASLEQALALHEELGTATHPLAGAAHLELAKIHLARDRLAEAEGELERAAAIWSETLPETHWRRAELWVIQGEHRIRAGERRRGFELLDQGITLLRSDRGEEHWRTRAALLRRQALVAPEGSGAGGIPADPKTRQ